MVRWPYTFSLGVEFLPIVVSRPWHEERPSRSALRQRTEEDEDLRKKPNVEGEGRSFGRHQVTQKEKSVVTLCQERRRNTRDMVYFPGNIRVNWMSLLGPIRGVSFWNWIIVDVLIKRYFHRRCPTSLILYMRRPSGNKTTVSVRSVVGSLRMYWFHKTVHVYLFYFQNDCRIPVGSSINGVVTGVGSNSCTTCWVTSGTDTVSHFVLPEWGSHWTRTRRLNTLYSR